MKIPRTIRRKIQSLKSRIRQSQHDSAWTGGLYPTCSPDAATAGTRAFDCEADRAALTPIRLARTPTAGSRSSRLPAITHSELIAHPHDQSEFNSRFWRGYALPFC